MRVDRCGDGLFGLEMPDGRCLIVDQKAKLELGAKVAVFMGGRAMLVGRLMRRPTPHRRLVISYTGEDGTKIITRIYGLCDDSVDVMRATGVFTPVPF